MAWRACRGDDGKGLPSGSAGGVVFGDRERRDRVERGMKREGYPNCTRSFLYEQFSGMVFWVTVN
jgi:hypothetical protein